MEKEMQDGKLIEVRGLKKYYPLIAGLFSRHSGDVKAVDGVSLSIAMGEILGLVGESGCGKSTLGRTILRLEDPTSGQILYRGKDITVLGKNEMRTLRKEMQIVFQDPDASLDPRMTVGDCIGEPLVVHRVGGEKEQALRIAGLMEQVGLQPEQAVLYPHEFSGGQKQRIGIARALALNPALIVADEPVSALDVSIQAQILNLLLDIQQKYGLSYLFIAHDLAVIKYMAHRIAVMYLGKIVELADNAEIFSNPLHPYTISLLAAIPDIKKRNRTEKRPLLSGDVPSPVTPPPAAASIPAAAAPCGLQSGRTCA
jgi:peptide/nickel transport system ATP-binding protein/oligopeptide transport system ATP-binding protein